MILNYGCLNYHLTRLKRQLHMKFWRMNNYPRQTVGDCGRYAVEIALANEKAY
jgi:hypothetical protein